MVRKIIDPNYLENVLPEATNLKKKNLSPYFIALKIIYSLFILASEKPSRVGNFERYKRKIKGPPYPHKAYNIFEEKRLKHIDTHIRSQYKTVHAEAQTQSVVGVWWKKKKSICTLR